jgi:uncharacterized membrane protein YhaH (DUF805 family)
VRRIFWGKAMDQININQLWQNFVDTVTNHYIDFNGRISRAHYWYYILVYVVVAIGVSIVAGIIGLPSLRSLYGLALFLPTLGMTARRLHDVGEPTSWVLILAVPFLLELLLGFLTLASIMFFPLFMFFAGIAWLVSLLALIAAIVIIYFCAQPGMPGSNEFGPAPPAWPAAATTA